VFDVITAMEFPQGSVAVDMTALTDRRRVAFTQDLLRQLRGLQGTSGHPHALLIHDPRQIHASQPELAALARSRDVSVVYVASEVMSLPEDLRSAVTHLISLDQPNEMAGGLPAGASVQISTPGADIGTADAASGAVHTAAAAGGTFTRLSPSFDNGATSSSSDRTLVTG
jgi:hypothetical protein